MQILICKIVVFIIFLLQSPSARPSPMLSSIASSEMKTKVPVPVPGFVKLSQDQTIFEGEEVMITCIVENIRGAVQWTKGGFGLPPLPASEYGNYDMRGQRNKTHGDYSLLIQNASRDDQDFFECQVRPAPGGLGLGALRSPKMFLTVKKAVDQVHQVDQGQVVTVLPDVARKKTPKRAPETGQDFFWIVTGSVGFLAGVAVVSLIVCIGVKLRMIICRCRERPEMNAGIGSPQTSTEAPTGVGTTSAPISQIGDSPGAKDETTVAVVPGPGGADFLDHRSEMLNDIGLCDIYSSPFSAMGPENNEFFIYDTISPIPVANFTDFDLEDSSVESATSYDYEKLYSLKKFCSSGRSTPV